MNNMREEYFTRLSQGKLSYKSVNILAELIEKNLTLTPVPSELLSSTSLLPSISSSLTKLPLYVARGHKSWGGLVVGFPGTAKDLNTTHVGTPYLRKILYPILDLFQRLNKYYPNQLKCIYFIGARFSDVFLRKIHLLNSITPHVIVLTSDLLKLQTNYGDLTDKKEFNESWVQCWLSRQLDSKQGLEIPVMGGKFITAGFLANELLASEGTVNPERLDILAYDKSDKTLIALEIKGPTSSRVEFENLLLQGIEHRRWLEANKMAVKSLLDGTAAGRINTRKRVRLIIGFFQNYVPPHFKTLRQSAMQKDKHLKMDFVRMSQAPEGGLALREFD